MALIQREQIPPCEALPEEEVPMPSLGGSVLVRGMTLAQLLQFTETQRAASMVLEGETPEEAAQRSNIDGMAKVLSMCALAADGLPVYSAAQWSVFAASHAEEFIAAGKAAFRMCGLGDSSGN